MEGRIHHLQQPVAEPGGQVDRLIEWFQEYFAKKDIGNTEVKKIGKLKDAHGCKSLRASYLPLKPIDTVGKRVYNENH